MYIDLLFDPFGAMWGQLRDGAHALCEAGFDGMWTFDHLAGSIHGAPRVVECWTVLTAFATLYPEVSVGPMVLNAANRDPAMLALMAATLQEVSGGRLLLGIGAGGGPRTPYADEQRALGRRVLPDAGRREQLVDAIERIRELWTGSLNGVSGFLRPNPAPPIVVGGFGPKIAQLAGEHADGINVPLGGQTMRLVEIARNAHGESMRRADPFVVTVSCSGSPEDLTRLEEIGADRAIVRVSPPYVGEIRSLAQVLGK